MDVFLIQIPGHNDRHKGRCSAYAMTSFCCCLIGWQTVYGKQLHASRIYKYDTQNYRHPGRCYRSGHLCLEIQRNPLVPPVNHAPPGRRCRVCCVLDSQTDNVIKDERRTSNTEPRWRGGPKTFERWTSNNDVALLENEKFGVRSAELRGRFAPPSYFGIWHLVSGLRNDRIPWSRIQQRRREKKTDWTSLKLYHLLLVTNFVISVIPDEPPARSGIHCSFKYHMRFAHKPIFQDPGSRRRGSLAGMTKLTKPSKLT